MGPDCLSGIALLLTPFLAVVSYRKLGRVAIPLTLLAVMAATGSMFWVNDNLIPVALTVVDFFRRDSHLWSSLVTHPFWFIWEWNGPGTLAVLVILWLILQIRRIQP